MSDIDKAIDRAVAHFGSQQKLADALGLKSAMAVSQWKRRCVPAEHCIAIEVATRGAVCCDDLRPDIEWSALRKNRRKCGQHNGSTHA